MFISRFGVETKSLARYHQAITGTRQLDGYNGQILSYGGISRYENENAEALMMKLADLSFRIKYIFDKLNHKFRTDKTQVLSNWSDELYTDMAYILKFIKKKLAKKNKKNDGKPEKSYKNKDVSILADLITYEVRKIKLPKEYVNTIIKIIESDTLLNPIANVALDKIKNNKPSLIKKFMDSIEDKVAMINDIKNSIIECCPATYRSSSIIVHPNEPKPIVRFWKFVSLQAFRSGNALVEIALLPKEEAKKEIYKYIITTFNKTEGHYYNIFKSYPALLEIREELNNIGLDPLFLELMDASIKTRKKQYDTAVETKQKNEEVMERRRNEKKTKQSSRNK